MSNSLNTCAWPMSRDAMSMAARESMPNFEWHLITCGKQVHMLSRNPCRVYTTDSQHSDPVALTCCNAVLPLLLDVEHGSRISRRCGPLRASYTWQWSWICIYGSSLDGPWRRHRGESLVEATLWMALGRRNPAWELLHHSHRSKKLHQSGLSSGAGSVSHPGEHERQR